MATQTIPTISTEELRLKLAEGEPIQLVNVLDPSYYRMGWIPGSRKIPVAELERRIGELDQSKEVIAYCAGPECHASMEGAQKLADQGFRVRAYEGGLKEWKQAGLPLEGVAASSADASKPDDGGQRQSRHAGPSNPVSEASATRHPRSRSATAFGRFSDC